MKVWVLTEEYNEYDQHGKYFLDVFLEKPHWTQLAAHGVPTNRLRHVLNGGGRVGHENNWFWLEERVVKKSKQNAKFMSTEEERE